MPWNEEKNHGNPLKNTDEHRIKRARTTNVDALKSKHEE